MPDTSQSTFETSRLDRIFKARSVVVVGASPERGTPRNSVVRVLLQTGFAGPIYLVHPKHQEVEGLRCYPDIASLPEAPDVALVITPAKTVPAVIADCGAKGIPSAVIFSAGFEEIESGKALAAELLETANRCGVAILGANCQGGWSIKRKTVLSFGGAALQVETLKHAPVAVVSQSGALGGAIALYLQQNQVGCSYVLTVGNETQIDILDCLDWVVGQDDVRTVVVYIEGLNDGARLLSIAERARRNGVQIVALKAGNSDLGQSATASHTGKIASPHGIYAGALHQAGVIMVESFAEVLAIIEALTFLPSPRVTADALGGVSVLSISGGACALLADHSAAQGVPVAEFSPHTAEGLEAIFPIFGRAANPADMTGAVRANPTLLDDSLSLISDDPRTEAFIMQFSSSGKRDLETKGGMFQAVAREKNLPIIMSFAGEQPPLEMRVAFRDNGVLFCQDPAATVRALDWLYQRARYLGKTAREVRPVLPNRAAPRGWSETMEILGDCGIRSPGWRILGGKDKAGDACQGLKYPLVVKALPEDAEHKTEHGLVALQITSPEEVDRLAGAFRKTMGKPEAGILVQEMVSGGIEVVLSCLRKTDFGPVLTIGLGGVGIELFRDVAHLVLPADANEVRDALGSLKLMTLLNGFRGKPRADIEALVTAAVRFGDMFLALPDVAELEINPLMVMPEGDGALAVDALVSLV